MRVIALVSLAFALAASSLPFPSRSNDVSASQDGPYIDITSTDTGVYAPGGGSAPGSEARSSGTYSPIDSGSSDINAAGGSTTVSSPHSRSFDRRYILDSVGGAPPVVNDAVSEVRTQAESAIGPPLAATNPITHNTPLRSRHVIGSGSGFGNASGRVIALVATSTEMGGKAGKFFRGNRRIPSGAEGAAENAIGGTTGSLAGSGLSTST